MIKTNKLCKTFSNGGTQVHVIKNLDMEIHEGDFTVIMGSSGSGKSTLMYALSGMDKPTIGAIECFGETITGYTNDQLAVFRRKNCGFIFQQIHLMDTMSVLDNVLAGGLLTNKNKKEVTERAKSLLTKLNIDQGLWNKFPKQLSGGEAQRVGVVRALINKPRLVFADEPTGALNASNSSAVLDVMTDLHREGQSIVMVTHDLKSALRGSRILYISDGTILGELKLTPYTKENKAKRMEELQKFLDKMGW